MGNACCHKGGAAVAVDSEAVGEAVDPTLKQEMQKLAATVSSLQSALAQLTQVNGSLQREQDALKVQVASSRGAGSLSIQDPGALPGGWQPEEGSSRPVRHQNSHNGRGGEGGSAQATAASVARLEAQVGEAAVWHACLGPVPAAMCTDTRPMGKQLVLRMHTLLLRRHELYLRDIHGDTCCAQCHLKHKTSKLVHKLCAFTHARRSRS